MVVAATPFDIETDQHVVLHGVTWEDFEKLLAMRGDQAAPRMYYLDGAIELMSPTKIHEGRKTRLARLLELWAFTSRIRLSGYGAWTLKQPAMEAGGEPDECYIVGADKDVPDLVIEVEWSRATGINKQEIYRRVGVRELWTLRRDGAVVVRVLEEGGWVVHPTSKVLPQLDVPWLVAFLAIEDQHDALVALEAAMRAT